jgi:hypothetical protein
MIKKYWIGFLFTLLILASYNPFDIFIVNFSGLSGSKEHLIKLWFVVAFILILYLFQILMVRNNILYLCSMIFSMPILWAAGDSIEDAADFIFLYEYIVFFAISSYFAKILKADVMIKIVFFNLLAVSFISLIVFLLFNNLYYFKLDFSSVLTHRNIDLVCYFLFFISIINPNKILNKQFVFLGIFCSLALIILTYMRGLYLSIVISVILFNIFIGRDIRHFNGLDLRNIFSIKFIVVISCVFISSMIYAVISDLEFLFLLDRFSIDNQNESSVTGRLIAYRDLLQGAMIDWTYLLFGHGIGKTFGIYNLPVSSSPSNFLALLYTFGIVFFSLFIFMWVFYILNCVRRLAASKGLVKDLNGLFLICSLTTLFILNVFPAPIHFPVYGFLAIFHALSKTSESSQVISRLSVGARSRIFSNGKGSK